MQSFNNTPSSSSPFMVMKRQLQNQQSVPKQQSNLATLAQGPTQMLGGYQRLKSLNDDQNLDNQSVFSGVGVIGKTLQTPSQVMVPNLHISSFRNNASNIHILTNESTTSSNKGSAASSRLIMINPKPINSMNNSQRGRSEFLDRFQGKTSVIAKDGHLGIVERTGRPIAKPTDTISDANQMEKSYVSQGSIGGMNKGNSPDLPNSQGTFNTIGDQSPSKVLKPLAMQFHRRNISEIVTLTASSNQSQPNQIQSSPHKAQTSPDKKPVMRREDLNRQYEKLKSNSSSIAAKSGVPQRQVDPQIIISDASSKSSQHPTTQNRMQLKSTLVTPSSGTTILMHGNNKTHQNSHSTFDAANLIMINSGGDRNMPNIEQLSQQNVSLISVGNQGNTNKVKAQFHSFQNRNLQNNQFNGGEQQKQTIQNFQNQPLAENQGMMMRYNSSIAAQSPILNSSKKRAFSISNSKPLQSEFKLNSSINTNQQTPTGIILGTGSNEGGFYHRMSQQYAQSSLVHPASFSTINTEMTNARVANPLSNVTVQNSPKSYTASKKQPPSHSMISDSNSNLNFSGIGNSIIMRKTDYYQPSNPPIVSNKRLFSKIQGIGPANVGTEDWMRARERQDRIQNYNSVRQQQNNGSQQRMSIGQVSLGESPNDLIYQSLID